MKQFALGLAAACLVGLTATACGNQRAGAVPDIALVQAGTRAGAEAEALLSTTLDRVYGTVAERRSGESLLWKRAQRAISRCMAANSQTYPVLPPPEAYLLAGAAPVAVADLTSFAPLRSSFGIASLRAASARQGPLVNPVFPRLSGADRARYADALQGCQNAGAEYQIDPMPPEVAGLDQALGALLTAVEERPEVAAAKRAYGACMAAGGYHVDSYLAAYQMAEKAFPRAPSRPTDVRRDRRWASAATKEGRIAERDRACRVTLHATAARSAEGDLRSFVTAHAAVLRKLRAERRLIVSQDRAS